MDGDRFDRMSRAWAERGTRRNALRQLGGAGVLAGVAAAFGAQRSEAAVAAQADDFVTCTFVLQGLTSAGPSKDDTWAGELSVDIGPDGQIDSGALTTADDAFDLVGQATGRAINLRVALGDGKHLTLVGTAQSDVALCRGGIDGVLGGPEAGDTGTWTAARKKLTASASATPTSGGIVPSGNGSSGGNGGNGSSGGNGGGGNGGPTPTPCAPIECGGSKMFDTASCQCVCYDNGVDCGPETCCPAGSICLSGGGCACPDGSEVCGNGCVPSCPAGQQFDGDCACEDSPTPEPTATNPCPNPDIQRECSGVCQDVVNDRNNCGGCGNVCAIGISCIAGTCSCPPGSTTCVGLTGCWASCV